MRAKRYPKYQPSGVEWLGDLPKHWDVKRLKYSATINDEVLPEATQPNLEMTYIDIGNVDAVQGVIGVEYVVFEDAPSRARRVVREGDTIVSTVRPYLRAIAPIRDSLPNTIVSTGFAVVRSRGMDPGFMSYALRESGFVEAIVARSVGVSYPAVNAPEIGAIPIPLPSVVEQRSISNFLDRETEKIDMLVAKKRTLIERLKEKRTALISRTVTRGLPPDAACAAGLDPHPKLKSSGIDWLDDVPAHWDTVALRRRVRRLQTGTTPPTVEERYYEDGTVPWYGPGSFDEQIVLRNPVKVLHESAVKEGVARLFAAGATFVVTIGATLGKVSSLGQAGSCNQQITAIEFDPRRVYARFATYQIKRLEGTLRAVAPSATLPILDQGEIGDVVLALPEANEQRVIAGFLDREMAKIDAMIAKIETAIERLQEYRTALVTAAVTGKIDVRDQTHDNERQLANVS